MAVTTGTMMMVMMIVRVIVAMRMAVIVVIIVAVTMAVRMIMPMMNVRMIMIVMMIVIVRMGPRQRGEALAKQDRANHDDRKPGDHAQHWNDLLRHHVARNK